MTSIFNPVLRFLGSLLSLCYSLTSSYGLSIAMFTLIIMVVFTPLTMKSTRSMMAMSQLQPEMKALQTKYRDDRQTLNTEMMALYQRHGVNPLGGCLPMLVQIPIFFMLFALLRGLTRTNSAGTEFNPKHLSEDSQLFKDLSTAGAEMLSLGIDLSRQANEVVSESLVSSIPYVLMVVVTGLTSWFQQRQMAARRTPGQEIPQQQQMLMKILPWTLPIFAFFMPAALVVYFIVSNLWRVGQQSYISKRIQTPPAALVNETVVETSAVETDAPKKRLGRPAPEPKESGNAKKRSSGPSRPRPTPRQRPARPSAPSSNGKAAGKGGDKGPSRGRGRSDEADNRDAKPAPTSRTAGHGPKKRPANKKKR
jgi:YidC/Oxa1 family membrane protein insertase